MKVGSLFSGGGLGDLGLMMAGMEIVWQVEIEDHFQMIFKLWRTDVQKWRDIRELDPRDLSPVDLCREAPRQGG